MQYEIVILEEKTVVGVTAKTNNTAPDMGMVIGGLWQQFYQSDIYSKIPGKLNEKALGIYTDYEDAEKGDYHVVVACETNGAKELPPQMNQHRLKVLKVPFCRQAFSCIPQLNFQQNSPFSSHRCNGILQTGNYKASVFRIRYV